MERFFYFFFFFIFMTGELVFPFSSAQAAQALQREVTLSQPNGYQFQARARGDEHFHFYETPYGYVVLKKGETWFYATHDSCGRPIASDVCVNEKTQRQEQEATLPFPAHLRPLPQNNECEQPDTQ